MAVNAESTRQRAGRVSFEVPLNPQPPNLEAYRVDRSAKSFRSKFASDHSGGEMAALFENDDFRGTPLRFLDSCQPENRRPPGDDPPRKPKLSCARADRPSVVVVAKQMICAADFFVHCWREPVLLPRLRTPRHDAPCFTMTGSNRRLSFGEGPRRPPVMRHHFPFEPALP